MVRFSQFQNFSEPILQLEMTPVQVRDSLCEELSQMDLAVGRDVDDERLRYVLLRLTLSAAGSRHAKHTHARAHKHRTMENSKK